MRSPNLREKYLDGEKLFRKYWEMGEGKSIALLTEWAITEGMTSSRGETPTHMGVWKALWRWASMKENRELAWKIYMENGGDKSWEVWSNEIVRYKVPVAWQHPTHAKRDKFLRENGWI
jgi:hypothetical protein